MVYKVARALFFALWAAAIVLTAREFGKEQALLLLLSGAAVLLVLQESPLWKGWGCFIGLLSEPVWIHVGSKANQGGQVIAAAFFVVAWSRGIWLNWIKPSVRFQRFYAPWAKPKKTGLVDEET